MFLIIYRFLINIVFIISPIVIVYRLLKKKEIIDRFGEKFCFFSKKKIKRNLIWFHGASVGEFLSIVPLIEKLEKDKNINQILVTSSTVSSAKVFEKFKFKKTIHQFFPVDTNFLSNKFLNYWKPKMAVFIDSEIWPNMLINLKKKSIITVLLNARITNKSFNRWKLFGKFSESIFQCFTKAYPCNKETHNYLKYFKLKNIKFIGNLKFSQKEKVKSYPPKYLNKFLSSKIFWCASSTHEGEELICAKAHLQLKDKYKKIVSIIIPRHIHRVPKLIKLFEDIDLKIHCHSWKREIPQNTDLYLVDTYGDTHLFYSLSKLVFMGGSIIKHGGQNPLEASRLGCNIIHGPNVQNFKDIYLLLKKLAISDKISSSKTLVKKVQMNLRKSTNTKNISKKIELMGEKILNDTLKDLKQIYSK